MSNHTMKYLTDNQVIESVLKGNQSDFEILIDRYKNKAFSMINRILRNKMEAEEVLQDCFIKAYHSLSGFRGEAKFSTWFYRIVYNTTMNRLSGNKRKIEKEMVSIEGDEQIFLSEEINDAEANDLSEFVGGLISQLPANHSSVISLFYLQGFSCEEISSVTGLSVPNVKVTLHRARTLLKDIIVQNKLYTEII